MIELIEDDIHKKWQVINIPRETNKITENENILGDTIIEFLIMQVVLFLFYMN